MYFLLKMRMFQLAMLVYWSVGVQPMYVGMVLVHAEESIRGLT